MSEQSSTMGFAHLVADSLAAFDWSNPGGAGSAGTHTRDVKFLDTTIVYGLSADRVAHIASVRTPRAKRGRGSARAAMERFLGEADWRDISVKLECSPLDARTSLSRLFRFYESLGFVATGRRINQAGDPEMIRHCREMVREESPVERYQWMRNKEGGQSFGNRQEILPLTAEVFDAHVRALLRGNLQDFKVYRGFYPEVTHVSMLSMDRGVTWRLGTVGSLAQVCSYPARPEWVVRVDSFESPEAITTGMTADSEYVRDPGSLAALGWTDRLIEVIRQGADIETADYFGRTPLHDAVNHNRADAVAALLDAGANPAAVDSDGLTPLHLAAFRGFIGIAQLLIQSGANINAQDNDGETPLHAAVNNEKTVVMSVLLAAGCDILARDKRGRTVADVAKASWNAEVRAIVEAALIKALTKGCRKTRSSTIHV